MPTFTNGPTPAIPIAGGGFRLGNGNPLEVHLRQQNPAIAYTGAAAPLLTGDLANGLITYNNAGANNLQLPLATDMDTAFSDARTNDSFEFSVISIGAGTATITTNTGWTLTGSMAIATNIAMKYRAVKTGAGAWTLYQVC